MPDYKQVLYSIETHSIGGILKYFEEGGNPNEIHDGVPLFTVLIEMYTRTPRFKECVKAFVHSGLEFRDEALLSVLMDDATKLVDIADHTPSALTKTYSLFNNAYTPLTGGTLLHICAEFNCINCAKILVGRGADVNARAALDEYSFGGHTPIFHTVNQNSNNSEDMLYFLLDNPVDLTITVKGLIWGKGYEWETWIPSVNPISYALMGLIPQMHRKETAVAETASLLVKRAYGIEYTARNVPCAYLRSGN
jgi:hypothetical protein